MITTKSPADTHVLVVGTCDLVNEILHNLVSHGVHNISVMDVSSAVDKKYCRVIEKDPLELIERESKYFRNFDIVLAANQPRAFELALSALRWPENGKPNDPDLPIIVMRSASNTCKMRCQYRERLIDGGKSFKFVSLPMELPPWTEEKRALVASTMKDEFKLEQYSNFNAYLAAAIAVIKFQQSKGSWPGSQDKEQVKSMAENGLEAKALEFIGLLCDGGLAAAHETIAILGRLVALETVKLLTGKGQLVNHINMEEVIQTMASR